MEEGKINRFVLESSKEIDEILSHVAESDVEVVDKSVVDCPHNGVHIREGSVGDADYGIIIKCYDCGQEERFHADHETVVGILEEENGHLSRFGKKS